MRGIENSFCCGWRLLFAGIKMAFENAQIANIRFRLMPQTFRRAASQIVNGLAAAHWRESWRLPSTDDWHDGWRSGTTRMRSAVECLPDSDYKVWWKHSTLKARARELLTCLVAMKVKQVSFLLLEMLRSRFFKCGFQPLLVLRIYAVCRVKMVTSAF